MMNPSNLVRRYFVFDVETPNGSNDRISSIGFALIEDGQVTETGEYWVNPETRFDDRNIELTGITPNAVKDAPTFPQVWKALAPWVEGSILVAHNARFDLSVLKKTASAYDMSLSSAEYLCTMELAKMFLPSLPHYGLKDLCVYYKIDLDHHQAGSDALACAKVLLYLAHAQKDFFMYAKTYYFYSSPMKPLTLCFSRRIFEEAADPVAYASTDGEVISVAGKSICLTGTFDHASRKDVEAELEQLGAEVRKTVVKKLDYLIVGGQGSDSWVAGNYGTKVKKALELQAAGAGVQIIREADFFAVLDRTPVPKQVEPQAKAEEAETEEVTDAISTQMRTLESDFIHALSSFDLNYDTTAVRAEHVITPKSGEYDRLRVVLEGNDLRKPKELTLFRFTGKRKIWVWFPNFICTIFAAAGISYERPDKTPWGRILFTDFPSFDAHESVVQQIFEEAIQGNSFDCCSRYLACSNAKKCIHPDIMMASQCTYRQNLHAGRIFYGENRNV